VFNNGVLLEGMVEKRVVRILNCFGLQLDLSKIQTIKFLFVKKSRIEWMTASRVRNQLARKVLHMIRCVVICQVKAVDTF